MDMHFDLALDFNMPAVVGIMKFMVRINGIVCCSLPKMVSFLHMFMKTCAEPEGGDRGSGSPLKNHKNIGFISDTGPDPLKNHKAAKPAFNVGSSSARQRNAI